MNDHEKEKNILLEFSITPMDKGESVGQYVEHALDIIKKSDLPYKIDPMSTCLEGNWSQVMAVVEKCFQQMQKESNRVMINMKVDYHHGKSGRIESRSKLA
ncbi:MAG: MTH1187 family thiamine-binding protein [Oligoflexia bacterium]|nr:MTH1187 family thiamine-binding protein [Oligoflexia bacterium]